MLNQLRTIFVTVLRIFTETRTVLSSVANIENNLLDLSEPVLIKTLLFGRNSFDTNANANVLNATIELKDLKNRFFNEVKKL